MATLEILEPGLATTVQDLGRPGYYHVGIPPSGALDQFSLAAANLLVGNAENTAGLECTYLGPKLRCDTSMTVAVTGATMTPTVDGEERPMWESFEVGAGQELSFQHLATGARAYLAFAGGIAVPDVLGSRSTYGLGAMGGLEGRALAAGDSLPLGDPAGARTGARVADDLRPALDGEAEVRIVLGLYDHLFTPESVRTFLETDWLVSPDADRVGFRYRGATLEFVEREPPFGAGSDPSNIVDAPYPIGSIQIPGGVEPIILHRDAVSGGGYAMIGTVIAPDLDVVAQSAPNTHTRFVSVDLDQALAARRSYNDRLQRVRDAVA